MNITGCRASALSAYIGPGVPASSAVRLIEGRAYWVMKHEPTFDVVLEVTPARACLNTQVRFGIPFGEELNETL